MTYDILLAALEALDAMGTSLLLGTLLAGALGTSLLLGRSAGRLSFSGHSVGMLQESPRQRRRQSRELLWLPFFL